MKKLLAIVLAMLMALACAVPALAEEAQTGGRTKVDVCIADALETLAPWGGIPRPSRYIVYGTLYQHLAQAEQLGSDQMVGVLAKEWEKVDDYTYVVTLYDYIVDTDGNPFTASDAVFSLENWAATSENYIESLEVNDTYTFTIVFNTTAPDTFQKTCEMSWMVTRAAYENSADGLATMPVGTTQYKVTEFVEGSRIVMEKVDNHWQQEDLVLSTNKANVDVIEYEIITEATQMSIALEQGTVQMACEMDVSLLDVLTGIDTLAATQGICPYSRGLMFCMTPASPFYDNLALRQAVCYAIDNEAVAEIVGLGYGYVSPTVNNYEHQIGYNPAWEEVGYYEYDTEKAKELLAEAGYKQGELNLRLLSNMNATNRLMWEVIQANLADVGINAEIILQDSSTYGASRDGTSGVYDLAYSGSEYGSHIMTLWNTLFNAESRASGLTWAGLDDPALQEKLQALNTPEGFTAENIDDFYYYIADNAFYYQVFMLPEYYVHDANITDVVMDCSGYLRANACTFTDAYDYFVD